MGNAINALMEVNVSRALDVEVQAFATSLTVPYIDGIVRDPFKLDTEDEALSWFFQTVRKPQARRGQYQGVFAYNIICVSKRGDQRKDEKKDRHLILASLVDNHFKELDLAIYDRAGGHATTYIGTLQSVSTVINVVDKRLMVFGGKTDRTDDTPPTVQAVVSVAGVINEGA